MLHFPSVFYDPRSQGERLGRHTEPVEVGEGDQANFTEGVCCFEEHIRQIQKKSQCVTEGQSYE